VDSVPAITERSSAGPIGADVVVDDGVANGSVAGDLDAAVGVS
jgi:hypothetical protein